ncbi:MAG TPA: type II toxin-antitoxin system Phd/YefM family antitoxin [Thermoanaerobaculia bacterium]|jgi:PHD/YefM family antitoxin component YafN of YafNO toxin-antitoxin module
MQKTIDFNDLESSCHAVLEEVAESHTSFVLTRGRQPTAALVPYEDFLRLQKLSERRILQRFDETRARIRERTARFSDEEVAADVAADRRELAG